MTTSEPPNHTRQASGDIGTTQPFPPKTQRCFMHPSPCRGERPSSIGFRETTQKSSINMALSELSLPTSSSSLTHPSHGQGWRWNSSEKDQTGLSKCKLSSYWILQWHWSKKAGVCNARSLIRANSSASWIWQTLASSMLDIWKPTCSNNPTFLNLVLCVDQFPCRGWKALEQPLLSFKEYIQASLKILAGECLLQILSSNANCISTWAWNSGRKKGLFNILDSDWCPKSQAYVFGAVGNTPAPHEEEQMDNEWNNCLINVLLFLKAAIWEKSHWVGRQHHERKFLACDCVRPPLAAEAATTPAV